MGCAKNCHNDRHVLLTQNFGFCVKMVTVTTFRFALFTNPYATLLYKSETSLKHFCTMASLFYLYLQLLLYRSGSALRFSGGIPIYLKWKIHYTKSSPQIHAKYQNLVYFIPRKAPEKAQFGFQNTVKWPSVPHTPKPWLTMIVYACN